MEGHKEVVKILLSAGADVHIRDGDLNSGSAALMWASLKGHKEVVELLLSAGADVNLQNNVCDIDDCYDE